jgi:thiol-disulfide isomerase/thioredoxin
MTQSGNSSSKSLTPTEVRETRKASLGLRLGLYATTIGFLSVLVPFAIMLVGLLGLDHALMSWVVASFLWVYVGTAIINIMASMLMIGAPQQMRVFKEACAYAFFTVAAGGLISLSVLRLPGLAQQAGSLLVGPQFIAFLLYLRKAARFTESGSDTRSLLSIVVIAATGVGICGSIMFFMPQLTGFLMTLDWYALFALPVAMGLGVALLFGVIPIRIFRVTRSICNQLESLGRGDATLAESGPPQPLYRRRPITVAAMLLGGAVTFTTGVYFAYLNFGDGLVDSSATDIADLRSRASQSLFPDSSRVVTTLSVGQLAPPFTFARVVHGDELAKLQPGNVYVVEFWATWCAPCLDGMPHISELAEQYDQGVVFVGVTNESEETVMAFLQRKYSEEQTWDDVIKYSLALDDAAERMTKTYFRAARQKGIPCAFIVGRDGIVEWIGHPMTMDSTLASIVAGTYDRDAAKRDLLNNLTQRSSAYEFNNSFWKTIVSPNSKPSAAEIERMSAICRDDPRGIYFNTLGTAQYRIGNYEAAVEACLKSVDLTPNELNLPGPHAGDLAVLAMSHFQLGDKEQAVKYRERLNETMELRVFRNDAECLGFMQEVNDLFAIHEAESAQENGDAIPRVGRP